MKADMSKDACAALAWLLGAAADCARRWGWSEQQFTGIARWAYQRAAEEEAGRSLQSADGPLAG